MYRLRKIRRKIPAVNYPCLSSYIHPLSSFRVQERPSKRSCIDIDPSPSALPGKNLSRMWLCFYKIKANRSTSDLFCQFSWKIASILIRYYVAIVSLLAASLKARNAELRAAISGRSDIASSESRDVSVPVTKPLDPPSLTP
ncbi:hypothetical protein V3C99_018640 [Haemonchus contortus]